MLSKAPKVSSRATCDGEPYSVFDAIVSWRLNEVVKKNLLLLVGVLLAIWEALPVASGPGVKPTVKDSFKPFVEYWQQS